MWGTFCQGIRLRRTAMYSSNSKCINVVIPIIFAILNILKTNFSK